MGQERLVSVDAFRGLTVAAMVLVNNPASWTYIYAPLRHAPWHGWTPTDLIFPFFLFIVGISISLSLGRRIAEGTRNGALYLKIIKRSAPDLRARTVAPSLPQIPFRHRAHPGRAPADRPLLPVRRPDFPQGPPEDPRGSIGPASARVLGASHLRARSWVRTGCSGRARQSGRLYRLQAPGRAHL